MVLRAQAQASGGLRRGNRDRGAELTTVAARLLFGLLAQLAGQIGEPAQRRIDADRVKSASTTFRSRLQTSARTVGALDADAGVEPEQRHVLPSSDSNLT